MIVEARGNIRGHWALHPGRVLPMPFAEAAARCRLRMLGIQRRQNQLAKTFRLDSLDGFLRRRVSVTHGHRNARVEGLSQPIGARLPLIQLRHARPAADARVALLHLSPPAGGDQASQGRPRQPRQWEVDDVGVGEGVEQERLDSVKRIGSPRWKRTTPSGPFAWLLFTCFAASSRRICAIRLTLPVGRSRRSWETSRGFGTANVALWDR